MGFHYGQARCFGKHVSKRRFPIGTVKKRQFHQGFTEVSLCAGTVFRDRPSGHQRFSRQTGKPSKSQSDLLETCLRTTTAPSPPQPGTDHDLTSKASAERGTVPGDAKKFAIIMEKRGGRAQIQKIDAAS